MKARNAKARQMLDLQRRDEKGDESVGEASDERKELKGGS